MAKGSYLVSLFKAFSKGDFEAFVRVANELIADEDKKGNHSLAQRLRNAISPFKIKSDNEYFTPASSSTYVPQDKDSNLALLGTLETQHLLNDVILNKSIKKTLENIKQEWLQKDKLISMNLFPTNKILLFGPPGCGKTMTAAALGNELGLKVLYVRFDSLISSYLGQTGQNIYSVFEFASKNRCLLILDEVDAIGKLRDDPADLGELKRTVIALMQNIDSFPPNSLLVAATNHPHLLDKALWRRFNICIEIPLPSLENRKLLFKKYLSKYKLVTNISFTTLAEITKGLSGADIETVCVRAAKRSIITSEPAETPLLEEIIFTLQNQPSTDTESLIKIASALRKSNTRKYTYQYLEALTGIPSSTLHYRLSKKRGDRN
ncbi:MAG: ATP-binding protein [Thermosipho sp. (in: Bacteria)]|nr:ATP-binding protein [Thermosipho sp. (in: thermotogales)]